MNLHLSMLIISAITTFSIIKAYTYLKILSINLTLASEPVIQNKINSVAATSAFNLAANQFHTWKRIWLPLALLALLGSISTWILLTSDNQLSQQDLILPAIVIASAWAKIFSTNTYPRWLIDWTKLLQSAREEVNLEYLEARLQFIKQQLQDVINGKSIPPSELYQLKHEGLMLSKHAEQYKTKKGQ